MKKLSAAILIASAVALSSCITLGVAYEKADEGGGRFRVEAGATWPFPSKARAEAVEPALPVDGKTPVSVFP